MASTQALQRLGIALLLFVAVVTSISVKREFRRHSRLPAVLQPGEPAPALELPAADGRVVHLDRVVSEAQLVVINFWASWCLPCRVELHRLAELYAAQRAAGLEVLAVNLDTDRRQLDAFLERSPLPFPVLLGGGHEAAEHYGVRVLPTTVLVDGGGNIQRVYEGFRTSLPTWIEHLLREPAADG